MRRLQKTDVQQQIIDLLRTNGNTSAEDIIRLLNLDWTKKKMLSQMDRMVRNGYAYRTKQGVFSFHSTEGKQNNRKLPDIYFGF